MYITSYQQQAFMKPMYLPTIKLNILVGSRIKKKNTDRLLIFSPFAIHNSSSEGEICFWMDYLWRGSSWDDRQVKSVYRYLLDYRYLSAEYLISYIFSLTVTLNKISILSYNDFVQPKESKTRLFFKTSI